MNATVLRIYHNGNVLAKNPHWHLGVSSDGRICGEVLPCEGVRKEFDEQLSEVEARILFETADAMSQLFPPVEQHVGHCHDDVCIQGGAPGKLLYRYIVPPAEQSRDSVSEFFRILKRVVEKYVG